MLQNIAELLENTCRSYPDKIGFTDGEHHRTFQKFREHALRLAGEIERSGYRRSPVMVFMPKTIEALECFFAVAYSGNFYAPVDVEMPEGRILKIMEVLKPVFIITDRKHAPMLQRTGGCGCIILYEEAQQRSLEPDKIIKCMAETVATDPLYVLFTSGSTGTPKGVVVSHGSVAAYTQWLEETFSFDAKTVFGNQTPFYFSMSVLDIFSTVRCAAGMDIIPRELFASPVKLAEYLSMSDINTIYWVPSALCIPADSKIFDKVCVRGLKRVLFSGEAMPVKQLNDWMDAVPEAQFVNLYGPTETTDVCAYYRVEERKREGDSLPIGEACSHCSLFVLKDDGTQAAEGEEGELCVGGPALALGYLRNPQKTAEAFVQNPLQNDYRELLYKTGDRVCRRTGKGLLYLGRKDHQIKHMGNRIELGEIETIIGGFAKIERCACIFDAKRDKIVLFYVGQADSKYIREAAMTQLPKYMLPNVMRRIESMPLNLNGKIDRLNLQECYESERI